MKKIISLIIGVSLALAPSAFALTKMSDSNMKSATGQAGVSIAIDNVVIESYTGSTSYTDTDGHVTYDATGTPIADAATAVVISEKHTIKEYFALTSATDFADDFSDATGVAAQGVWNEAHALTIDVGTCATLSEGISNNMLGADTGVVVAGVIIGLPTLLINTTADTYTVGINMADSAGAANDGGTYIQISKGASSTAILSGTLEIAPH